MRAAGTSFIIRGSDSNPLTTIFDHMCEPVLSSGCQLCLLESWLKVLGDMPFGQSYRRREQKQSRALLHHATQTCIELRRSPQSFVHRATPFSLGSFLQVALTRLFTKSCSSPHISQKLAHEARELTHSSQEWATAACACLNPSHVAPTASGSQALRRWTRWKILRGATQALSYVSSWPAECKANSNPKGPSEYQI